MPFNRFCYGILTARQQLQKGTIVKIPTALCSKWKLNKLVDNHVAEVKEMATCSKCHKKGTFARISLGACLPEFIEL